MFAWLSGKPPKSAAVKEAEAAFTAEELQALQQHYKAVLAQQAADLKRHGGASASTSARGIAPAYVGLLLGGDSAGGGPGVTSTSATAGGSAGGGAGGPGLWPRLQAAAPLLASRLLGLLTDPGDGTVHVEGLVLAKARLERLGEDEALGFTFRMLEGTGASGGKAAAGRGSGSAEEEGLDCTALQAAVVACVRMAAEAAGLAEAQGQAAEARAAAVALGALALVAAEDSGGDGGRRLSRDAYRKWVKRVPALHAALSGVLLRVGAGGGGGGGGVPRCPACLGPPLPQLVQLGKLAPHATLLQLTWSWVVSSRLPPAQRREWRLLFSSHRDGKSFNTFFGRVSATPGPTLLLIREKAAGSNGIGADGAWAGSAGGGNDGGNNGGSGGGRLFGGYAPQPWAKSGTFYGDVSSFIFRLEPTVEIFPATGINDNYQWCGVGFSQLPGGLGFGGAATPPSSAAAAAAAGGAAGGSARGQHFALYVDPSLDGGMSRPIATYGNTPLASEQVFQIDTLECWLLQPPEEESDPSGHSGSTGGPRRGGNGGNGGSILDKAAAADKAILQMGGFKLHSEGVREEPLEED